MRLQSESFENGKPIPTAFTCDGGNLSPQLSWDQVPEGTRSFAIFCTDPDAPTQTWHHWAAYDLPPSWRSLPEAVSREASSGPLKQGINDFGNIGYDGPCPPRQDKPHHYRLSLLALSVDTLPVATNAACEDVERTARRYCIDECLLSGIYSRAKR